MYKIFCDETWTASNLGVKKEFYVFYGILVDERSEGHILEKIDEFKRARGLYNNEKPVEIKWKKVDKEWKDAKKSGRKNRYEEFLDIFFEFLEKKILSFGVLYLPKSEYDHVETVFVEQKHETRHDFFFMLYYQFLYHCFIKNQVKGDPCRIFIDDRNLGEKGKEYDPNKIMEILNKRIYRESIPRNQLILSPMLQKKLSESIQLVDLEESKQEPLIQMADLCAGCVRFVLEHELPPPPKIGQLQLFADIQSISQDETNLGKEELARYFYQRLRTIDRYDDINLLSVSYHHRFSIFPFRFSKR